LGRALELGQILVHGGLQDRVCGIEAPVGEMVAHAGDLPSRDRRLRGRRHLSAC
jgi:hypothetical protein